VAPSEHSAQWDMAAQLQDVLPIFVLTEPEREELVAQMQLRRFREGEVVYHRGDPAAHACVVFQGLVKCLLLDEHGHELLVALYARGQFFGELAMFEDAPRETTAVAVIPTSVFLIPRAAGLRILERNPQAMRFMFSRMASTIHGLSDLLEGIVFLDVPSRLAKYLMALERVDGAVLTQDDIAAAIGSTRVTVNKTLADFEKRGLIAVDRRHVRIIDESALRKVIQP
jgi:CRP/FNR family cyclic AMP-dependent transcriptional regulator